MLLFHAFYDTDRTEDERDRIMYFKKKNKLIDSLVFFLMRFSELILQLTGNVGGSVYTQKLRFNSFRSDYKNI